MLPFGVSESRFSEASGLLVLFPATIRIFLHSISVARHIGKNEQRPALEAQDTTWQRYLPFWTANLIDRMKIMLVPLLTILVPLIKIMPPTYRWQVRRKIYRWYHQLHAIDIRHPEEATAAQLAELLQRLDTIEEDVRKVRVPLSYSDELYNLRLHIGMLRNRLQDLRSD